MLEGSLCCSVRAIVLWERIDFVSFKNFILIGQSDKEKSDNYKKIRIGLIAH